jgi:hypothetical protein
LLSNDVINWLSKLLVDFLAPGYKPISDITPEISCGIVAENIAEYEEAYPPEVYVPVEEDAIVN